MNVSELIARSNWKKLSNKQKVALNKVMKDAPESPYLNHDIAELIKSVYFDIGGTRGYKGEYVDSIITEVVCELGKGDFSKIKQHIIKP